MLRHLLIHLTIWNIWLVHILVAFEKNGIFVIIKYWLMNTYRYLIFIMLLLFSNVLILAQTNDSIVSADSVTTNYVDTLQINLDLEEDLKRKLPDNDTTVLDSLLVTYFKGNIENYKLNRFYNIDTNTYNYQKFDPLYRHNGMYSTLSNIGQASKNMVFSPTLSVGYLTKPIAFAPYMYENDSVQYYNITVPYTNLDYVMSAGREQNFNVIFTRKIFTGFTFGLNYAINYSPNSSSPYVNNGSNIQRFYLTSQYYTKNKRYGILGNYLNNKLTVNENGGIKYDSVFEQNIESDRRIIAVNLSAAENLLKQSGFYIEQYFNLLKPLKSDSSRRRIDPGNISYSFQYQRNRFTYTDPNNDSTFYFNPSGIFDSTSTFDSLTQIKYQNILRWSNIGYNEDPSDKIFYIYAGGKHTFLQQVLPYDSVKSNLTQLSVFGGVAFNFGRSFHLSGNVEYYTGNYNDGDLLLDGTLRQYLGTEDKNIGYLKFGINLIRRSPNWYLNNYQSNHYSWNNNFNKENYLIISGSYNFKTVSAGVKFFTIGNYTYLNDSIRPAQLSKTETVLSAFAQGTIPLKKFGINTRLVYQSTSQPNVIRLPQFTGVLDIYFRSQIFKKAGTVQTGFQVTYFSSYYADSYMPELRQFYLQNEKQIGNYPYIDVYLTLMVKRARLFVKYSHFNSLFGNYSYFLAPHYPAREARFSFGASWRFHD